MLYCQKQLTGLECNRGNLKLLLAIVQQQENEMHEMGLPVHILDQAAGLDGQNRGPSRPSAGLRRDGGAHAPQHMQECHWVTMVTGMLPVTLKLFCESH